jgi:hypothetical protein
MPENKNTVSPSGKIVSMNELGLPDPFFKEQFKKEAPPA